MQANRLQVTACLMLIAASFPGQSTGTEYQPVQLIDTNPSGGDFINGLVQAGDRWLFEAYDGSQHKIYSTDGQTTQELVIEGNGSLRPEPLFTPKENGYGIRRLNNLGYFVAEGPEGRSLYKTNGLRAEVLASGVSGKSSEDVYLPPMAWKTGDYLYFRREASEATGLYRTDGNTISQVEFPGDHQAEYRFLREFEGDAILVGSSPEGDFLVRENASGSEKISTPPSLNINASLPMELGDRFGFTGSFGAGQRLFFTDGESIEMIDFDLGRLGVQKPVVAEDSLFFKGQSNDVSPYKKIFHFNGQTIKPLELGFDDHSGMRIVATEGNEAIIVGRGLVRTDGTTTTAITNNIAPHVGGAWLAAQTENVTLLLMDTSTGQPFSRQRGLYRIVDDQATLVDIGSEAENGYAVNRSLVNVADDAIYFTARGKNGSELFRLINDELTEFDINPDGHSGPESLRLIDNKLFFAATGPNGREAYVLDGDELSLIDINPAGDSDPWFMAEVNGTIFVLALTGNGSSSSDRELIAIQVIPEPSAIASALLSIGIYSVCRFPSYRKPSKML